MNDAYISWESMDSGFSTDAGLDLGESLFRYYVSSVVALTYARGSTVFPSGCPVI